MEAFNKILIQLMSFYLKHRTDLKFKVKSENNINCENDLGVKSIDCRSKE